MRVRPFDFYSMQRRQKPPNDGMGRESENRMLTIYDNVLILAGERLFYPYIEPKRELGTYQKRKVLKTPSKPDLVKVISEKMNLRQEDTKQILGNLSKDIDSIFNEIGEPLEPENRERLIEGIIESIETLTSEIIEKV